MPNILFIFMVDSSCLQHASFCFLSRYHLDTTSLSLNYYSVLSPYSPSLVLGEGPDDLVLWDALALIRQVSLASTRYTLPFPPLSFH